MSTITIGVLALQGAFAEHIDLLNEFPGVVAKTVKQSKDMEGVDGLILPGGESTVQGKWLAASDLGDTLRQFTRDQGRPVFGTCAGFILLANRIRKTSDEGRLSEKTGGQYRLEGMNVEIERNYFGRQIDSFEANLDSEALGTEPFHAVFIRAPAVHEDGLLGPDVQVLATVEHAGKKVIVAARENNFLGTSFHPELTTDRRWHEYFVQMVRQSLGKEDKEGGKKKKEEALIDTRLPDLDFLARGKVRDIYTLKSDDDDDDDDNKEGRLLFVTTDRISAYDVIMQNGIPEKGKILTALSEFWFGKLARECPHHLLTTRVEEMPAVCHPHADQLAGRSMLVRKLRILPIEAIVRGYLTGSAWKEYRSSGTVHGITIRPGMIESEAFDTPIFTPSTKAEQGEHDENIHPDRVAEIIGPVLAERMAHLAVTLYTTAAAFARTRGILIADTKFEFGVDAHDRLVLVDEVLTPDSSRFWPAEGYAAGRPQPSFDKQFLRDYLTSNAIDKREGVVVPDDVVAGTRDKYRQVYERLTGKTWSS